jgi:membrane protease YdiL (CAAX protease family)
LIVIVLDVAIFVSHVSQNLSQMPQVPVWQRFLACFYGGITEELFMRLGLFSLLAWLLGNISHTPQGLPGDVALWTANILVAMLFGLGHLPATAKVGPLTAPVVIRTVVLNGLASLVFGYLYWTQGLESAMLAHFMTDFVSHVIAPLFV